MQPQSQEATPPSKVEEQLTHRERLQQTTPGLPSDGQCFVAIGGLTSGTFPSSGRAEPASQSPLRATSSQQSLGTPAPQLVAVAAAATDTPPDNTPTPWKDRDRRSGGAGSSGGTTHSPYDTVKLLSAASWAEQMDACDPDHTGVDHKRTGIEFVPPHTRFAKRTSSPLSFAPPHTGRQEDVAVPEEGHRRRANSYTRNARRPERDRMTIFIEWGT